MIAVSTNEMYLRFLNVTTIRTKAKVCCLTKESYPVHFPIGDSRMQPTRDHEITDNKQSRNHSVSSIITSELCSDGAQ
jgi:hypothetical protein